MGLYFRLRDGLKGNDSGVNTNGIITEFVGMKYFILDHQPSPDSGSVVLSVYDYCPSDITSRAAGDFIRVPNWNLHLQQWFPKKAAHLLYPRNFAKRQTSQAPDCWIRISRNLLFEAPRWFELLTDMELKGMKACILTLIHSWFQPVIGTLPGLDPGSVEIQMGTSEVLP